MKPPIYLDYHATTPLDPRVFEAMRPYFVEHFGNAASRQHAYGWTAEAAVEKARGQIAAVLGALPQEIIFTSGATEANNLALLGLAEAMAEKGRHLTSAATEHRAVLDPLQELERRGFEITLLPVDPAGRIDLDRIRDAIKPATIAVSFMAANNEIGTIHPLAEVGAIAKERGVLFHCDAAQAAGKIPLDVEAMGIDLLTVSAHKIYGPKGVGALYVRSQNPKVRLKPQLFGGGHERGLRSGTLNVPGIVGMGEALALAAPDMKVEAVKIGVLRDRLWNKLQAALPEIRRNGDPVHGLTQNLNVTFPGVPSDWLMMELRELAVASGSACSSASPEPSHVLRALGLKPEEAKASIRFGLGRFTTLEEVDEAAAKVVEKVLQFRKIHGNS
ncbi:MAG TPA: aminotransferase class V-fold PLP-dependent enzyme [bacterium]|nr:aminotransferase class V-fold PLP-dependent enzyme [bacterium]